MSKSNKNMSFTGHEAHNISLADASALTKNFRDSQSGSGFILGEYFSKDAINSVLNQTNCVGIRIYYGLDSSNVPKQVIVGVLANENDMTSGAILEFGSPCPPGCSTSNSLNS